MFYTFDRMGKGEWVESEKLVLTNPLLDRRKLNSLRRMKTEQILALGDITVSRCSASGVDYVVDGNHRVSVLKSRRVDLIPVMVGEETDVDFMDSWAAVMAY